MALTPDELFGRLITTHGSGVEEEDTAAARGGEAAAEMVVPAQRGGPTKGFVTIEAGLNELTLVAPASDTAASAAFDSAVADMRARAERQGDRPPMTDKSIKLKHQQRCMSLERRNLHTW